MPTMVSGDRRRRPEDDRFFKELRPPTDWRAVPADVSVKRWNELRDWVHWLTHRYALDTQIVPPCWYHHPALVDLLTALRDHHRYAFDQFQPAIAGTDWHRTFADLETRLRAWASRTGCNLDQHRPDITTTWPDNHADWQAHLDADHRGRNDDGLIGPTASD